MGIEINHLIVPAKDRKASARFLGEILGVEPGPAVIPHFEPLQVGGVTLDFADSDDVQSMHIAFGRRGDLRRRLYASTGAGHRHLRRPDAEPTR